MLRYALSPSSSTVLRRAVRAVLGSFPASRTLSHPTAAPFISSELRRVGAKIPSQNFCYNFSTAATNSINDHELIVPTAPADFPFTFLPPREDDPQLKENFWMRRDFNEEKIVVMIYTPTVKIDLSSAAAAESDHGVCLPENIILDVKIADPARGIAHFGVAMCPHQMLVHALSFMAPNSDLQLIRYGMHDLDGKGELQFALQEYLKIRGFKPCYAEFMYIYMVWKSRNLRNQVFSNNFSAVASAYDDDARQTVDRSLRKALEHEIDYFDPSAVEIPDAPAGFAFEIEDVPEQMTVKMKREFEGEKIEVKVFPPVYPADVAGDGEEIPAKVCGGCPNEVRIQLIMNITKEDGEKLEINFWGVYGYGFHPITFEFNGILLSDEKVLGFDWVEIVRARGVDASMAEFMMKYMKGRSDRNSWDRWITLKKFREFVKE